MIGSRFLGLSCENLRGSELSGSVIRGANNVMISLVDSLAADQTTRVPDLESQKGYPSGRGASIVPTLGVPIGFMYPWSKISFWCEILSMVLFRCLVYIYVVGAILRAKSNSSRGEM